MAIEKKFRLDVKEPDITSLILLSAFAAMGAVLMTPALPAISTFFQINNGTTQLTVSTFLFGYALGQLIYGPIANRVGRKPAFYIGIAIATTGSLFSILSAPIESFHLLILGRLLEALGSSVGLVVCFTIINDFYFPEQSRIILAFLMLAFAIVPGFATAAGGLLTDYISWKACFYFLLLYGLVLIYPAKQLPETITQLDPNALRGPYLVKNYIRAFKNRNFIAYSILYGLSTSCVYVFGAEGPFIGIHSLHLTPSSYGLLGFIPFLGAVIGSIFVLKFSSRWTAKTLLRIGIICEMIATAMMFVCFLSIAVNLFTLLFPTTLLLFGHALISSNASYLAMSQSSDKANGSAVMSFITMGSAVIMTVILSISHSSSTLTLPSLFTVTMVLLALDYLFILAE